MTHMFKLSRRTARLRAPFLIGALVLAGACDSADSFEPASDPTSVDHKLQPSLSVTSSSITISNISVQSGKTYQVGWDLGVGDKIFVDRDYTYTSVPSVAAGLAYIRTATDDKNLYPGDASVLSFDISTDATIYVGHDNRVPRPSWLTSNFQDTGSDLASSDGVARYSLFKRSYPRGRVTLGSNVSEITPDQSMYVVLIQPVSSSSSTGTTTAPSTATASGGGIPFGLFNMPVSSYGSLYNGSVRYIWPEYLLKNLADIKARGGKVVLSFHGPQSNVKDGSGNFSLTKWKSLVERYRAYDFSSYIKDGTIVGHYLIDEPSDKSNWNGATISPATVEAMAKHSKTLWPGLRTIVRDWPSYMDNYTGTYTYLDAAWMQYRVSKGAVSTVLSTEVAAAKSKGLALIVGLNLLDGGANRASMTPTEIKSWGGALLASSYPCGFISWQYGSDYLLRSDVKSALGYLRDLAKSHAATSCAGA